MKTRTRFATRVLLVNGSREERQLQSNQLETEGYCTLLAATAEDAYRLAAELEPSVIVTTIDLAGDQNGFDFVQRVRRSESMAGVPTVILTRHVSAAISAAAAGLQCTLLASCGTNLPDALAALVGQLMPSAPARRPVPA